MIIYFLLVFFVFLFFLCLPMFWGLFMVFIIKLWTFPIIFFLFSFSSSLYWYLCYYMHILRGWVVSKVRFNYKLIMLVWSMFNTQWKKTPLVLFDIKIYYSINLSISRFILCVCVSVRLSVCVFTFEAPFSGLFAPNNQNQMS